MYNCEAKGIENMGRMPLSKKKHSISNQMNMYRNKAMSISVINYIFFCDQPKNSKYKQKNIYLKQGWKDSLRVKKILQV